MLLRDFAGKAVGIRDIYETHSVGRPFVLKEYREVLCSLEQSGALTIDPPCPPRRKGTLAEHAKISFRADLPPFYVPVAMRVGSIDTVASLPKAAGVR